MFICCTTAARSVLFAGTNGGVFDTITFQLYSINLTPQYTVMHATTTRRQIRICTITLSCTFGVFVCLSMPKEIKIPHHVILTRGNCFIGFTITCPLFLLNLVLATIHILLKKRRFYNNPVWQKTNLWFSSHHSITK